MLIMRRWQHGTMARVLWLVLAGCGDDDPELGARASFAEFPWAAASPDVRVQRLCREAADPDRAADPIFVDCRIEGASFAARPAVPKADITVVAYNIERGFGADGQIEWLRSGSVPQPDVILLSEVDRGCRRTGFRNIVRDYATALEMYYVYATEFVELPATRGFEGPYDPPLCEHGNAILSRYPLGNVRQIRHAQASRWYTPPGIPNPDEPRLGGRVAVVADVKIGRQLVRAYSLHLESRSARLREAQVLEVIGDAAAVPHGVVIGGDLNAYLAVLDLRNGGTQEKVIQALLTRGYSDAHAGLPVDDRSTSFDPPSIIDFIFVRGLGVQTSGLCPQAVCGGLSDHLPVWSTLRLP